MSTISGQHHVEKSEQEVMDRLRMLLAAANCKVEWGEGGRLTFRRGSYSQNSGGLPMMATMELVTVPTGLDIYWAVDVRPLIRIWLTLIGILGCWTIFAPILAYRALRVEPRQFMENLLNGL